MRKACLPVAAALLALTACGEAEKGSRGIDYVPDMYESPAYKSQQTTVVAIKDGVAQPRTVMAGAPEAGADIRHVSMMIPPPAGTVPRDFLPYQLEAGDFAGAKQLVNPLAPTAAVVKRGRDRYNISCAVCHGNDGNAANGYVAAQFAGIPSLNGPNLPALSDGEIYHIVTLGRNRMPNYRAQLLPEDRWAVVHYVRLLNRAALAASDADAALKAALEAAAAKPEDAEAKAALAAAKTVAETARRDLDLIKRTGDAADYTPLPEPKPEYVKPTWPEAAK